MNYFYGDGMAIFCSEFLGEYSDFRDGLMSAGRTSEMLKHMDGCSSCSQYHHVVVQGVDHFRALPEIEADDDFLHRLQHRIYHLEDQAALRGQSGSPLGLALTLAVGITLAAWLPLLAKKPAEVVLPPVAARLATPDVEVPALFRSGPLLPPQRANAYPFATPVVMGDLSQVGRPVTLRMSMPLRDR